MTDCLILFISGSLQRERERGREKERERGEDSAVMSPLLALRYK